MIENPEKSKIVKFCRSNLGLASSATRLSLFLSFSVLLCLSLSLSVSVSLSLSLPLYLSLCVLLHIVRLFQEHVHHSSSCEHRSMYINYVIVPMSAHVVYASRVNYFYTHSSACVCVSTHVCVYVWWHICSLCACVPATAFVRASCMCACRHVYVRVCMNVSIPWVSCPIVLPDASCLHLALYSQGRLTKSAVQGFEGERVRKLGSKRSQ